MFLFEPPPPLPKRKTPKENYSSEYPLCGLIFLLVFWRTLVLTQDSEQHGTRQRSFTAPLTRHGQNNWGVGRPKRPALRHSPVDTEQPARPLIQSLTDSPPTCSLTPPALLGPALSIGLSKH
ncbi:unnamed protein product [Arctogadus glacialis]